DYMLQGGFPYVVKKGTSGNHQYTKDTLEYIFEHIIRHHKRIKNRDMYFAIQDYIVNNYGRAISIKSMQESLFEKLRQPIRKETLYNYLNILEDARIVYKCSRYDMKEKRIIKGKEKYYLSDLSIYYAADLYNTLDVGPSLENVVYAYARVHGYAVALGKSGRNEFDFAVEDANMDYSYIQVADHIVDGKIDEKGVSIEEEEEYKPLQRIRDSYPKYILTLDKITHKKMGIKHFNVIEFMLENGEF
nr:ATP-binding protein [Lachnospiraceae bacterium]